MIRVWEENRTACNLYKKLGFRPIAAITQTKRRPSGEPFEMRKLYFLMVLQTKQKMELAKTTSQLA